MTEAEWRLSQDAVALATYITRSRRRPPSDRKLRLLLAGPCRVLLAEELEEERFRGMQTLEEAAEKGGLRPSADTCTFAVCVCRRLGLTTKQADVLVDRFPWAARRSLSAVVSPALRHVAHKQAKSQGCLASLIRCVIGNPFCPVTFSPSWRTDTAVALARTMYESRDFSAMPILADALQDAGCDSEDVLNHCRGKGVHVRGCWVVDLVLGKK